MHEKEKPVVIQERPTGPRISLAPKLSFRQLVVIKVSRAVDFCRPIFRKKIALAIVTPIALTVAVDLTTTWVMNGLHLATIPFFVSPVRETNEVSMPLPCDLVVCAEAYSVTRTLTKYYVGPLFQLYNGSTTLDIGQVNGVADMTTWSAFCGGVQANCVVGKIYAQIYTDGADDIIPSQFNGRGNVICYQSYYQCATAFKIEVATGLPIFKTVDKTEYTVPNDNPLEAVIGGLNDLTMVLNARDESTTTSCCGNGLCHRYDAVDVVGTCFTIILTYGNTGGFGNCKHSNTYCTGLDYEIQTETADIGSSPEDVIAIGDWKAASNLVSETINNAIVIGPKAPIVTTLNPGTTLHLGGGGDLSQPAPIVMRELFFTNSVLSSDDKTKIFNNMVAFYPSLSFP